MKTASNVGDARRFHRSAAHHRRCSFIEKTTQYAGAHGAGSRQPHHADQPIAIGDQPGDKRRQTAANHLANPHHQPQRGGEEDRRLCDRIADHGAGLVKPGSRLLTHCNTGGLATAGVGTAIGVLLRAHRQGKVQQVWVDETRPLLQGGRLTAWELGELGIPYRLICDSMAASLMAQGQVDAVWVGADRIAANGDVANKIGTYSLAVLAHYHGIPFYVAAPHTTHDPHCPDGAAIPIEQRAAAEVTGVSGSFGACQWAPNDAPVYNPAFDVTPAKLISGWIFDSGVITPQQVEAGIFQRALG